jgi:homoserine kinase
MTITRASAFAPATMANVGVGFDILGLAVDGAGDTIIVEWRNEPGAVVLSIEGDNGKLPHEADRNVASIAANAYLKQIGATHGLGIHLKKGLPLASGLGSSAASSVAAVVAANTLCGSPLKQEELLDACLEGEAAVSGRHADNVAPSLFGGITLTNGTQIERIRRIAPPPSLYMAFVTPNVAVPTAMARAALPTHVTLKQMVQQTGAVAELVDAIYRGDVRDMAAAMERDGIVEPARAHLMPLFGEMRPLAKDAGALALVISGAGPTLCAVCEDEATAARVAQAMQDHYTAQGYASLARHGKVRDEGAVGEVLAES